jgi:hypothetical protein
MKDNKNMNNAANVALRDISNYLQKHFPNLIENHGFGDVDVWCVTPSILRNKNTTLLNRELGIYSINKGKHNMSRKKLKENEK